MSLEYERVALLVFELEDISHEFGETSLLPFTLSHRCRRIKNEYQFKSIVADLKLEKKSHSFLLSE